MRNVLIVVCGLLVSACQQQQASPLMPSSTEASVPMSRAVGQIQGLHDVNRYCFLLTIDSSDSRANVIKTIRGNGSLLDLIQGVDPEPSDPSIFNRYILKPSLLPVGTPELAVQGGVGINSSVPAVVRNEYSQDTALWWTLEFFGITPTLTRAQMQTRMINEAYINRLCTHYWQIVPGDSLTVSAAGQAGDLLSKFVLLP